jgi:hypothetical protein
MVRRRNLWYAVETSHHYGNELSPDTRGHCLLYRVRQTLFARKSSPVR